MAHSSAIQRLNTVVPMRKLARISWLRRLALGLLARLGRRDIQIGHHWIPGTRVRLDRFRHKGYWFHGRQRERNVMESFALVIQPGDTVIELGGHIGYISLWFAHLVGDAGRVYVFEPSPDNLRYIEPNTAAARQVALVRKAAGASTGTARFFVEGLTGQNSTLIEEYAVFSANRSRAFSDEGYRAIEVEMTTLDDFVAGASISPDFIKIDIEGAEIEALRGMPTVLERFRPTLMVEVTREDDAVMALLRDAGYVAHDSQLRPLGENWRESGPNRFFLPAERSPPAI